jgi:hypothetical protein
MAGKVFLNIEVSQKQLLDNLDDHISGGDWSVDDYEKFILKHLKKYFLEWGGDMVKIQNLAVKYRDQQSRENS